MIRRSGFRANVTKLASGTAASQVITIAALPVLTRLYSPSEFGILAILQGAVAVVAILATGRYEFAVISADRDLDAWTGVWLICAIAAFTGVIALSVGVAAPLVITLDQLPQEYFILVAILALLVGVTAVYQALYSWANRMEQFGRMAINGIVGAIAVAGISITFGVLEFGALGLVMGSLAGQLTNTTLLAWQTFSERGGLRFPGVPEIKEFAKSRFDFPKYLIPSGLMERVTNQLHIFVLSAIFGASVAGSIGLYRKVVSVPSRTIGNAVRHVFRQRAAKELNENGECTKLFRGTSKKLFLIGAPLSLAMVLLAPTVFAFVFGAEWREAGKIAQLLAPMFLIGFVASPLSSLILVGERQKYDLALQIVLMLLTVPALVIGSALGGLYWGVFLFGIAHCVKYVAELYIADRIASGTA
jgi:O-antigen/teichoic acid export membrane protein